MLRRLELQIIQHVTEEYPKFAPGPESLSSLSAFDLTITPLDGRVHEFGSRVAAISPCFRSPQTSQENGAQRTSIYLSHCRKPLIWQYSTADGAM